MTSIAIALGMLSAWAAGLAVVGAYWVKREKRTEKIKEVNGCPRCNATSDLQKIQQSYTTGGQTYAPPKISG